jgi:nicotinic acid mononucleotide adenylyltransferase
MFRRRLCRLQIERYSGMRKETLEKIFEYASMPVHGTLSRKLRKDISFQVNDGEIFENVTLFLGEEFVRVTGNDAGKMINTYYDWEKIVSVRTIGVVE